MSRWLSEARWMLSSGTVVVAQANVVVVMYRSVHGVEIEWECGGEKDEVGGGGEKQARQRAQANDRGSAEIDAYGASRSVWRPQIILCPLTRYVRVIIYFGISVGI